MKARIFKPTSENIKLASQLLEKGELVIYPTDSAYALGCDVTNSEAAEKIFRVKGRQASKQLPMIVPDLAMAKRYGVLNQYALTLCKQFMPGQLTLIVPKKNIPDIVNKDFVFRIPASKIARELARELGKPVVSTSANLSGEGAIYDSKKVIEVFNGKVAAILDAGKLASKPVSTIVKDGKIVRRGAISEEKIASVHSD